MENINTSTVLIIALAISKRHCFHLFMLRSPEQYSSTPLFLSLF